MEELLIKIFLQAFPEVLYMHQDEGYSADEALSPRGLLPIFVEQAQCMANVLGPEQLRGVQIVYDSSSLLGRQVVFEHNALPQLVLPFVLDAGHIALSETQRLDPDRHETMVVDHITPPIVPTCESLFRRQRVVAPTQKQRM